jgi:hypothetical protein
MILILNHQTQNCGVYQYGRRFADIARKSKVHHVEYREIATVEDYKYCLYLKPEAIIFNWYPITMGWLTTQPLDSKTKNYFLFHDGHIRQDYYKYIFCGSTEKEDSIRIPDDKKILLPRPLLEYDGSYKKNQVPTIGSFGFGFWHKGFPDIVKKANKEFDKAVIRLHIPNAHYGDAQGVTAREVIAKCKSVNKKSSISLEITTEMKSDKQLLEFLAGNDINVFMYNAVNEGLSSVIDYALSVKRPLAITDNMMFRHVRKSEILTDKNTFQSIIDRGTSPLSDFYNKWSQDNFISEFDNIFLEELNNATK